MQPQLHCQQFEGPRINLGSKILAFLFDLLKERNKILSTFVTAYHGNGSVFMIVVHPLVSLIFF